MNIIFRLILLLGLFNLAYSFAGDIEYQHKSLKKALEKNAIKTWSNLNEITVPLSLDHTITYAGKFFQTYPNENNQGLYIYVGRVNSCRSGSCSINMKTSEYFDYFIIYNHEKVVKEVKVFNYQATHGQEITTKGWLKQFVGFDGSSRLEMNKSIDGISGATVSVTAIIADVNAKGELLRQITTAP